MKKPMSFNANADRTMIDLQHELVRMDSIERSWFQRVVGIAQKERNALSAVLRQKELFAR